ncbi:MAG TPA: hypothetical protein ENH59_03150 [Bacteroidetes bacterium]|nr:hypothetical protein [Bacteroidota bacterium]
MFVNAIEEAGKYTRPIHTISKSFRSNTIIPGVATLFFVNDKAYSITCTHLINLIVQSKNINKNYSDIKAERERLTPDGKYKRNLKALMMKYKTDDKITVQLKNIKLNFRNNNFAIPEERKYC